MKLEGRIDKKKKRATRRGKYQNSSEIYMNDEDGGIRIDNFKRPKLNHDMSPSFICTPKQDEGSPHFASGLHIIPGSPQNL